jgi:hypothetical protein
MILFPEIQFPFLSASCNHCSTTTIFTGYRRYRVDEDNSVLIVPEYQCQDCGKLTFSMPDTLADENILSTCCECGGQFRRDKPLFCSSCKINRTPQNTSW